MFKKYFFILFLLFFSVLKSNPIRLDSLIFVNEINISKSSNFAFSNSKNNVLPNDFIDYNSFKNKQLSKTSKVLWQQFSIQNRFTDTLYIYSKSRVAKMELFVLKNGKLQSIGHTGFAHKLSNASVKNYYNNIIFPNHPEGDYYVKITSERYRLNIPEFYLGRNIYKINDIEDRATISILVAGIQICLIIICLIIIVTYFFRGYPPLLFYFIIIGFFETFYFLLKYHILNAEVDFLEYTNSQFWNVIGDFNIIFYYVFFIQFFKIPNKSLFRYIVYFGITFWFFQIFVELSDFNNPILIQFATNYLNYASTVDFIIMTSILVFVIKNRLNERFFQIGFVGLLMMWLSSLDIALPHLIDYSDWTLMDFFSFGLMQFSSAVNAFAVVGAFVYDFTIKEKERQKLKSKLLQQKFEKLELINKERERISQDMHDDLGAGISALKLQSEFLKKRLQDSSLKKDVDDIIKTTQDINLSMREMLWSLNTSNDNVENLVHYIIQYGEHFFRKTNINFISEIVNQINDYQIDVLPRRNIYLCVKEAFNNCYKHSNGTMCIIKFSVVDQHLIIEYHDNGVGIKDEKSSGNGIRNMEIRMKECNGELEINSENSGLKIKFKVPIKKKSS